MLPGYNIKSFIHYIPLIRRVQTMAILQAGYYDIGKKEVLQHTYLKMSKNRYGMTPINFNCYGSHDDNKLKKPLQKSKQLPVTSVACDERIAFHLSTFSLRPRIIETEQNNPWSNSGIVYALNGVCHQMANTILAAATPEDVKDGWILTPPSFFLSQIIYSKRGSFGILRDRVIQDFIRVLNTFYQLSVAQKNSKEAQRDLSTQLANAVSPYEEFNKRYLTMQYPKATRQEELRTFFTDSNLLQKFLETSDVIFFKQKQKLDQELLLSNISPKDYADTVNSLIHNLVNDLATLQSPKNINPLISETVKKARDALNVINPDFMTADYTQFRKEFGLE